MSNPLHWSRPAWAEQQDEQVWLAITPGNLTVGIVDFRPGLHYENSAGMLVYPSVMLRPPAGYFRDQFEDQDAARQWVQAQWDVMVNG